MTNWEDDDEDFSIRLHHKKPLSAGLRRQKITFVRASSPKPHSEPEPTISAEDFYLNLVLPNRRNGAQQTEQAAEQADTELTCEVCSLPLPRLPRVNDATVAIDDVGDDNSSHDDTRAVATISRHETSLAHQVCLAHAHPPSALVRSRVGFAYLASRGWDPDARIGLGAEGQGMQAPLQPREKQDVLGIGAAAKRAVGDNRVDKQRSRPSLRKQANAGNGMVVTTTTKGTKTKQRKEKEIRERHKLDRLRDMFNRNVDIDKYLGPNA